MNDEVVYRTAPATPGLFKIKGSRSQNSSFKILETLPSITVTSRKLFMCTFLIINQLKTECEVNKKVEIVLGGSVNSRAMVSG